MNTDRDTDFKPLCVERCLAQLLEENRNTINKDGRILLDLASEEVQREIQKHRDIIN